MHEITSRRLYLKNINNTTVYYLAVIICPELSTLKHHRNTGTFLGMRTKKTSSFFVEEVFF